MDKLMSMEEWMKRTDGGVLSKRSNELKIVDNALRQYNMSPNESYLQALNVAMSRWLNKEGPGDKWKNSIRNKNKISFNGKLLGPVDVLFEQLQLQNTLLKKNPSKKSAATIKDAAELERVMVAIRKDAEDRITSVFQGKMLVARNNWSGLAEQALSNNKTLGSTKLSKLSNASTIVAPASAAYKLAKTLSDSLVHKLVKDESMAAKVLLHLGKEIPGFMGHLTASLVPFAGVAQSGASAAIGGLSLAWSQYKLSSLSAHAAVNLSTGDPGAAVKALIALLERARNEAGKKFAVGLTEFGGKLAAALADGGTASNAAIGMAGATAKLALLIMAMDKDLTEAEEANHYMSKEKVSVEVFKKCPIVGAYMISCIPTSDLVNSLFETSFFMRPDAGIVLEQQFMAHIVPLRQKARDLILAYRMHIPELEVYARSFQSSGQKHYSSISFRYQQWEERTIASLMGWNFLADDYKHERSDKSGDYSGIGSK